MVGAKAEVFLPAVGRFVVRLLTGENAFNRNISHRFISFQPGELTRGGAAGATVTQPVLIDLLAAWAYSEFA